MQAQGREVKAQIRANGQKIAQFSAREISVLAEAHLAQHREQLRALALGQRRLRHATVASRFAQCGGRNLALSDSELISRAKLISRHFCVNARHSPSANHKVRIKTLATRGLLPKGAG